VGLSLARFWRAFGISGGLNPAPQTLPLGTPLAVSACTMPTGSGTVHGEVAKDTFFMCGNGGS